MVSPNPMLNTFFELQEHIALLTLAVSNASPGRLPTYPVRPSKRNIRNFQLLLCRNECQASPFVRFVLQEHTTNFMVCILGRSGALTMCFDSHSVINQWSLPGVNLL
jgi:hypothetical protein